MIITGILLAIGLTIGFWLMSNFELILIGILVLISKILSSEMFWILLFLLIVFIFFSII